MKHGAELLLELLYRPGTSCSLTLGSVSLYPELVEELGELPCLLRIGGLDGA